ncbi:dienelactone hydrolase family protein [Egicoccus sp. AB-alg6-2]|uniref:dienelactone hydrolase family protein n=1 Tax=Egicoccus sp. AB-alg6-2 TaxID=3242692 RepID=UPI00359CD9E1
MSDVLLFHHAQGLTAGVQAFAERLRAAGHRVTAPDLYDGATFADLDAGVAHAEEIGFDTLVQRGVAAAAELPETMVYAGFSLGVMPAQKLAQTRPGAHGALLYHEGVASSWFGGPWPTGVALQVHVSEQDPWCELDVTRGLVEEAGGELFLYPGDAHLFTDASLEVHDPAATDLVVSRSLAFLDRLA